MFNLPTTKVNILKELKTCLQIVRLRGRNLYGFYPYPVDSAAQASYNRPFVYYTMTTSQSVHRVLDWERFDQAFIARNKYSIYLFGML